MRRKSYTAAYKLKVVEYAEKYGTTAASIFYEVNDTLVLRWKKSKDILSKTKKTRRAFRGAKPMYEEVEQELNEWILQENKYKKIITKIAMVNKAKEIAESKGITEFKCSNQWILNFMRRNNIKKANLTNKRSDIKLTPKKK